MPGKVVVDTNVVIDLLIGDDAIDRRLKEADDVYVSCISVGELYYGAYRSARPDEERRRIDGFLSGAAILDCTRATAELYAAIRQMLKVQGRPIPESDLWIAATALEHNCTLLTRDAHFSRVETLSIDACRG